jgi:hypothetical protein
MKKLITRYLIIAIELLVILSAPNLVHAQAAVPDTVKTGIYITSIHNIDFKQKEYTIDLWLWLKYKNPKLDFLSNMEIPMAKTVTKSFSTIDTSNGKVYLLMKLQCVMQDNWAINNFPFDRQVLRFSLENSQFDSSVLVFVADTLGKHCDPRFALRGWNIDSVSITTGKRVYETTFGDSTLKVPRTVYSNFRTRLVVHRDAMGLFWKMFLGMYVAFLIAFMCFFIHEDGIDSRFGLSVGALFAVVGNKYIVDASLPESSTFTLVDTLHGITLFYVLLVIVANSNALRLAKQDKIAKARKLDKIFGQVWAVTYILINCYFIYLANHQG